MGKYYKKPHKKSYKPTKRSVTYPSHKYSYGLPKHYNNRKGKKYTKYEWYNEDTFWSLDEFITRYKEYEINLHWRTVDDAIKETANSSSWLYPITSLEEYNNNKYKYRFTMKPRWRAMAPYIQEDIARKHKEYNDGIVKSLQDK